MNLLAEFSRRQLINLLEKAVVDRKLPDTLLFQFESCVSWPFTKAQEQILLSYATVGNLKKSAGSSAATVKTIGKMAGQGIGGAIEEIQRTPPSAIETRFIEPVRVVERVVYQEPVSREPRYSRGEWERIQKSERDKEIAKAKALAKAFPKEPTLNTFYRKVEIEN